MTARIPFVLLLATLLGGCSMFHPAASTPPGSAASKKSTLWPFAKGGPQDATPFLEYERKRSEADKSMYTLSARNTHQSKTIEGDIRTTIETGANETKVDNWHFSLGPNETRKLLVYPEKYHLTYEVTAVFKQ